MESDWQNSLHKIKERGLHILHSEKWTDCRFLVGTAPNQRIIAGHKLLLAMASPVFEAMFYGKLADKTDPIIIPDVQPDAFHAMLEYIYSDRININCFDKACELCYVAKKYMLPHVVEQCTHFLWADLSPKNACRAYEFATLFDESRLMQSSMEIIAANTREVIDDPSFVDIEISTLMSILDQDKLNITSELDLFNGIVRYANERGMFTESSEPNGAASTSNDPSSGGIEPSAMNTNEPREIAVEEIKMEPDIAAMMHNQQVEGDASYEMNEALPAVVPGSDDVVVVDGDPPAAVDLELRDRSRAGSSISSIMDGHRQQIDESILRQAVKKIRFLTLTPQQFAEGPARSKLLQQHEALAILIKISSPSVNDLPMPEGFCSIRCTRNYYTQACPREMSSYRVSVPPNGPNSSCYSHLDTHYNSMLAGGSGSSGSLAPVGSSAASQSSSTLACGGTAGAENDYATNDTRRSYCVRTINQQFDYRNTSVTDCGLSFQVDTNIWITGVQVPTQVLCGELMNSAGFSERYTEILYAHIQDVSGSRLAYTHCTSRVRYDSLLDISFDRPVYIYRNQIYKVFVVFNKVGWYPIFSCVPDVICNRVKFSFNVGDPGDSLRDGLIRAIIFTTPQDHARTLID